MARRARCPVHWRSYKGDGVWDKRWHLRGSFYVKQCCSTGIAWPPKVTLLRKGCYSSERERSHYLFRNRALQRDVLGCFQNLFKQMQDGRSGPCTVNNLSVHPGSPAYA